MDAVHGENRVSSEKSATCGIRSSEFERGENSETSGKGETGGIQSSEFWVLSAEFEAGGKGEPGGIKSVFEC